MTSTKVGARARNGHEIRPLRRAWKRHAKLKSSTALQVEWLPIGSIQPDPRNPRQHGDRQIDQIARSIETFGFIVPILIDRNGNILAGVGRWSASKKLGLGAVPVITIAHLADAQAKAFRIADNRLTDNSVWDDRLLARDAPRAVVAGTRFSH